MIKVAIITTQHAINYGAVLQAFSLKKAIEENINSKVDILNYCSDEAIAGRKIYRDNNSIKNIIINAICWLKPKYRNNRRALFELFDQFKAEYLGIESELITSEQELMELKGYDIYVCGSDQIWNLNLFKDPAYFLTFVSRDTDKVAYAVSISDQMSDEQMQCIADKIRDYRAISIRELDDAKKLSLVTGQHIDNVIDPVFLHNSAEWFELLSVPAKKYDNYLFVFLISHQDSDQKIINRIRGDRKVVILNLHPISYVDGDEEINVCSPAEFVGLIARAGAIITDSFHCTAFSIIFNKNFYNIKRPTRNNRIENLYHKLHITSRYINTVETPCELIEYEEVNVALKQEALKGKQFIINHMGER